MLKSGDAPALVSNMEVLSLLQERMAARQSRDNTDDGKSGDTPKTSGDNTRKGPFRNRDWMEQTVLNHLKSSPVGGDDVKVDDMSKLVQQLRRDPTTTTSQSNGESAGYGLTNAETLQILNHLPTSLVELHLLVEDIEKRETLDTDEKQLELLRLISRYSGRPVEEAGDGADADEEMEEE